MAYKLARAAQAQVCGIIIGEGQDIVYPEYDNHLYFTRNLAICKAFV